MRESCYRVLAKLIRGRFPRLVCFTPLESFRLSRSNNTPESGSSLFEFRKNSDKKRCAMLPLTIHLVLALLLFTMLSCAVTTSNFSRGVLNVGDEGKRISFSTGVGTSNYYYGESMGGGDMYAFLSTFGLGTHFEYGLNNYVDIGAKVWFDIAEVDLMIGPTVYFQPVNKRKFKLNIGCDGAIGINGHYMIGFNYLVNPKIGISFGRDFTVLGGWSHREVRLTESVSDGWSNGNKVYREETTFSTITHWSVGVGKKIDWVTPLLIVNWGIDMDDDSFVEIEAGVIFENIL